MSKYTIFFLGTFFLFSCSTTTKVMPLKGHYVEKPFQVKSEKSREEVWSNIIDFFGQNGIGIRIIDKSSWIIISDAYNMPFSYEDSKGNLINPEAFLVARRIITGSGNRVRSFNGAPGSSNNNSTINNFVSASAEWNIILKEQQGKAIININIVNPRYTPPLGERTDFPSGHCFSTGVFEKKLSEILK